MTFVVVFSEMYSAGIQEMEIAEIFWKGSMLLQGDKQLVPVFAFIRL